MGMADLINRSIEFFDTQFHRQVQVGDFTLNPFEELALPYLCGRLLDLGCGLGNLTIWAARRGCSVLAVDASPKAIERVCCVAAADALPIETILADLATCHLMQDFDVIVSIGLLMFFDRSRAQELLTESCRASSKNGRCDRTKDIP